MFDCLFPGWSAPRLLALVVALRTLCNVVLTASMWDASRLRLAPVAGGALTVASAVLTIGVLRGAFGLTVSHVEGLVQLTLVVVAAVVVARGDASKRWRNRTVLASVGAVFLYLISIPLFGEATVAP